MSDTGAEKVSAKRTFISYASEDRSRVAGLVPLLQALGHEVFFDQRSLLPGQRWEQRIEDALHNAEALLVFWTRHAARSKWVRYEYERFAVLHPDAVLTALLGDETTLTPLLSSYQRTDFVPLVNELLAMQRRVKKDGIKPDAVRDAILKRLHDAGIDLDEKSRRKLMRLFLPAGLAGLLASPGLALLELSNVSANAVISMSGAQAGVVVAAAFGGAVVCGVMHEDRKPTMLSEHDLGVDVTTPVGGSAPDLIPPSPLPTDPLPLPSQSPTEGVPKSVPPAPQVVDCAKISCDCPGIDAGLLTGPWRDECRNQEKALRAQCQEEGKFPEGACVMAGPNPFPSDN